MSLIPFLNRHAGETAWLFGKGPSLSTFDFTTAGPLRVAINDVIAHVPACVYGFSNDGVGRWRDVYQPGQIVFQPLRCMGEYDSRHGGIAADVVVFEDGYDDLRLFHPREELARALTIRRGTLGSALQILHIMGVRQVHLVGIDGGRAHAPGFDWRTRLRAEHGAEYSAIRNEAIDAARLMGITLTFHDTNHMETDGKTFVRITSNTFAEGVPYSPGQIVSLNPRVARDLFNARAAEPFTPPAKAAPAETAIAPMQARENATIPTKKAKTK